MKSNIYTIGILLVLSIFALTANANTKANTVLQEINFILLGTDVVDAIPSGLDNDIKSLYVSSDRNKDSVYFKIEVYGKLKTFGFYIFFDSDLNVTNGFSVTEPITPQPFPTPNGSMKFDGRLIYVSKNALEPSFGIMEWNGEFLKKVGDVLYEISDSTIIISAGLSQCDYPEFDGMYNCVLISAEPDFGKFIDFIPDDTYFSIGTTDNNDNHIKSSLPYIYPNPASDYVFIDNFKSGKLIITDIMGMSINTVLIETVKVSSTQALKLNIIKLPTGTYLIRYPIDNKYYTNILTIMK